MRGAFALFICFARDLTLRSVLWCVPLLVILAIGLAHGLESGAIPAVFFAGVTIVLTQHARGFGKNLSWLHVAPLSRSRLWWLNVFCALYACALILAFVLATVAVFVRFSTPVALATANATPSSVTRQMEIFGPSLLPYLIVLVVLFHSILVQPLGGVRNFGVLALENAFVPVAIILLFLPRTPLVSALGFLAFVVAVAHYGTRSSVLSLRLPRVVARRFLRRYWLTTSLLAATGLFFVR